MMVEPEGRPNRVHGAKLKLVSLGGVLYNLMEDVVEDQIAKRRRVEAVGAHKQYLR